MTGLREANIRLLTIKDLAERWGVSEKTVRRIPKDKLPVIYPAVRRRRYHPDDVAAYEQKHRRTA